MNKKVGSGRAIEVIETIRGMQADPRKTEFKKGYIAGAVWAIEKLLDVDITHVLARKQPQKGQEQITKKEK